MKHLPIIIIALSVLQIIIAATSTEPMLTHNYIAGWAGNAFWAWMYSQK